MTSEFSRSSLFYGECIRAFKKLRAQTFDNGNRYIDRVYDLTLGTEEKSSDLEFALTRSSAPIKRVSSAIRRLATAFPTALEIRRFHRVNPELAKKEVQIFCFQNSRTPFSPSFSPLRRQLLDYLQPMGAGARNEKKLDVASDSIIYLLDVGQGVWSRSEITAGLKEHVVILNEAILIADAILKLLCEPIKHGSAAIATMRELLACVKHKSKDYAIDLAVIFYVNYFSFLLSSTSHIKGCLFTSNSVLAESLRFYLMRDVRCRQLCEISHGINSVDINTYITSLSLAEGLVSAKKKHRFVEQIPDLPSYGEKGQRPFSSFDYAVNVYLNRFRMSALVESTLDEKLIQELYKSLSPFPTEPFLLLTFSGYADFQANITQTKSFEIECFLIDEVIRISATRGINLQILYAAHPASDFDSLENHEFFSSRGISTFKNTMKTFFFADISIALLSATSYESAYFNVRSFTPQTLNDNLHPREYLDLLHHPVSGSLQSLKTSILDLIESTAPKTRLERELMVKQRVKLLDSH